MRISTLLNVPLGAIRKQQQQHASTLAPNWHFLRVAGRTRRKKHAAGHCLRDNVITWASMLISARLNVPLGALDQQQQQSASILALNWHFLRVVGGTRRKKHAAGHYLRDNLITWASMLICALLNVPLGRLARSPRGLRQLLPLPGLNGCGNRERAAESTATEQRPGWMPRNPRCLRHGAQTRLDASESHPLSPLPLPGLNGCGNREHAAERTATEHSPRWMFRGHGRLPMSRASQAVPRARCRRPPLQPSVQLLFCIVYWIEVN